MMSYLSEQDYSRLQGDAARIGARQPLVQALHYDEADDGIVLLLADGVRISIPVTAIKEFRHVPISALKQLHLTISGEALELDEFDIHISTRGLLRDILTP